MTDLIAHWISQPTEVELERIARKVAQASIETTKDRLSTGWSQQSTSFARGYLRSRSRRVVKAETLQLLGPQSEYSPAAVEGIIARAIELTADRLMRQQPSESVGIATSKSA